MNKLLLILSILLVVILALPASADTPVLSGDAKKDGVITIADAIYINQYLAGLREGTTDPNDLTKCFLPDAGMPCRDWYPPEVDPGFDVTACDAQYILDRLAGLRNEYYQWIG